MHDTEEVVFGNLAEFQINEMRKYGDSVALTDADTNQSYTYADVIDRIQRLAAGLKSIGLRQGDVLCALSFNTIEYPVVWYAVNMLGATFMTASPEYTDEDLKRRFTECATKFLVTTPPLARRMQNLLCWSNPKNQEFLKTFIVFGEADRCFPYSTLFSRGRLLYPTQVDSATSVALLLSSSGTSGLPKFVQLTHTNLIANLHQIRELYQHRPGMVAILSLPMFHAYGLHCAMGAGLYNGIKFIVMKRFLLEEFMTLIKKHKAEILQIVPTIASRLVKYPDIAKMELSTVKYVQSGGAPIGIKIAAQLKQLLQLDYLNQSYGTSECGTITGNTPSMNKPGSEGVAPQGVQIKITDPDTGITLPANKPGEICVKGPQVFIGYLNQPEVSRQAFDDDKYFKTGDLGYLDSDGFLFIVDRLKELIKYKGYQVAPAYLEDLLVKHPDIADAAVIGIQDTEAGELPKAFVVRQPWSNISETEVINYIKDIVSPYMRLRGGVEFISKVPRNPSGKIFRRFLRGRTRQAKL